MNGTDSSCSALTWTEIDCIVRYLATSEVHVFVLFFHSPKGAISFPDRRLYEYDQIRVACVCCVYLFRFMELFEVCIFLCRLVLFVSTLVK